MLDSNAFDHIFGNKSLFYDLSYLESLPVSQCTWLFLVKNRFDDFSVFQSLSIEIQNQFGTSIKIFMH